MNVHDVFATVNQHKNYDGNPQANLGFSSVNWNARVANDNTFVGDEALATWVRANSANVRNELEAFSRSRDASPTEHAIRCFLFAVLSPQIDFNENIEATKNLIKRYDTLTDHAAILDCLTVPFHGTGNPRLINLAISKANYIYAALPWLDRLNDGNLSELFTYDYIRNTKGFAEKTTAMALALYNEYSHVFTLDQWMLRLTLALNNHDTRVKVRPTSKGYAITAERWLTFCREYLSDHSPFAVQWTLWNGCHGGHASHLGILA